MISLKPGASLEGTQQVLRDGLDRLDALWKKHGMTLVVTSGMDGKHMTGSLHYKGLAADLRFPLRDEIKATLGPNWDVVWEKDHIHVEFDPKQSHR